MHSITVEKSARTNICHTKVTCEGINTKYCKYFYKASLAKIKCLGSPYWVPCKIILKCMNRAEFRGARLSMSYLKEIQIIISIAVAFSYITLMFQKSFIIIQKPYMYQVSLYHFLWKEHEAGCVSLAILFFFFFAWTSVKIHLKIRWNSHLCGIHSCYFCYHGCFPVVPREYALAQSNIHTYTFIYTHSTLHFTQRVLYYPFVALQIYLTSWKCVLA